MDRMMHLSDDVIILASQGDPDAIVTVLEFYGGYINTAATERVFGSDGCWHTWLNEDRRSYIHTYLIKAIKKWRAPF